MGAFVMLASVRKHSLGESASVKPLKKPTQYRESVEQREVVKWIRARPNWLVMRMENAAKRTGAQYARDHAMGMEPGAPDLIVYFRHFAFYLEMKEPKGRTSEEQDKLHKQLRARGSFVLVGWGQVRTIEALEKIEVLWSHNHDNEEAFVGLMQNIIEQGSKRS